MLAWLSIWSEVQTCIWPSWCHCHWLSLAPVKSRLVLPFWYRLTRVVLDKGPLNGCVCVCVCACFSVNYCFQTKTALLKLWHFCDSGEVKSFRTHLLTYSTRKRCQCSCQTCGADEVKCELLGGVNKSVICKLDADIGRERRVVKHDGDWLWWSEVVEASPCCHVRRRQLCWHRAVTARTSDQRNAHTLQVSVGWKQCTISLFTRTRLTALCPGLPGWAGTRKVKPSGLYWSKRQWHQLGRMQVCTSLQTDNLASTPPLSFLQAGCPYCRPTNSIKALKFVTEKR